MTYSNEQIGLELRDTFRGLSDEFMDVIVGGPQVRRFLCHRARESAEWRSVREIKVVKISVPFPPTCRSPILRPHLQVDLAGGKHGSTQKHRKGHPKSGKKARPIKGIRPKAEIRPHPTTETNETVRMRQKHENTVQNHLIRSLEKRPRCALSGSSYLMICLDRACL